MAARANRAERLARLEQLLFDHPGGLRAVEIANRTSVQRRTIYRDIEALRAHGVPIWQDAGRFGLMRDQYQPAVRLDFDAVMVLFVGIQLLAGHGTEQRPAISATLDSLTTALPKPLAALLVRQTRCDSEPPDEAHVTALATIAQGWLSLRMVRLWYEEQQFDVAPYLVTPAGVGGVYLVGHDAKAGAVCAFRLDRVQRALLLEETFVFPADLESEARPPWQLAGVAPSFEIVLDFDPDAAPLIQARLWHPTQLCHAHDDGGCRLTIRVAELDPVRGWVLGWGAAVEVVAPPVLRDAVAAEAQRVGALYA
ncbi:MAG: transcriptional regulator [Anaerolineae bacterium]|nr:transcriptional regulator [Anaerolineae bacterium]